MAAREEIEEIRLRLKRVSGHVSQNEADGHPRVEEGPSEPRPCPMVDPVIMASFDRYSEEERHVPH